MERSAEQEGQPVVEDGVLRSPEQRPVRRRLVQSTLFPHRSPESGKEGGGDGEETESEEEEHCLSRGKKKEEQRACEVEELSPRRADLMEKLGEQVERMVDEDGAPRPPERRPLRRRLIQSTLFSHRPQDNEREDEGEGAGERGDVEEVDSEDEEYCGSQGKKEKKSARKGKSRPRNSNKVAVNCKEVWSRRADDNDCTATAGSDFLQKVSGRGFQKRQKKEQKCMDSPGGNDKTCSPVDSMANVRSPQRLKKRQVKTTPTKNLTTSGLKGASLRHLSTNPLLNEHGSHSIPDLRLEAKMTAEENSRMFAGRQIHPFFSSWKTGKRCQETAELDTNWCSAEISDKSITFGPIHVFERVQDDAVSLDWGNWVFCDSSFINTNFSLEGEGAFLSAFEDSVESLNFENVQSILPCSRKSVVQNDVFLVDSSIKEKKLHGILPTYLPLLAGDQIECCQQLKGPEMEHVMDNAGFSSGLAVCLRGSNVELQSTSTQERMVSNCLGRSSQPEDSLWTNKYLPEKATEVCGNGESVKFLNEWLRLWHERDSHTIKNSATGETGIMPDVDFDYQGSESDSEDVNEDARLKNVLLITGPVGSGKSAAVYACAKEQGFQVLELNTSDWRNGALVKLRIGEALESHSLKWSLENTVGPRRKHIMKSFPSLSDTTAVQELNSEVTELIHLSDDDSQLDLKTYGQFFSMSNGIACHQDDKTLILFEDVDITSIEDRGFVAAIQQLAETAKQPMILTSNSSTPPLPDNLNRLKVSFTIPSPKELLCHLCMVCAAERANIQPHMIEQFIKCCQGDIRKTIMHLQFWCQHREETKLPRTYSPLLFDLDAGHQLIPKLIPWNFPSQLSEKVEKEISKSLSMEEENCSVMKVAEEEELVDEEMQNDLEMHNNETDSIEAKKEAMLSRNCSIPDCNGHTAQFDISYEFSNSSGSPVAFTRRSVRRKLEIVMSSSSEDEFLNDGFPAAVDHLSVDTNSEVLLNIDNKLPSHCLASQSCPYGSAFQLFYSEGEKLEENHYQCSEAVEAQNINSTCKLVDVSCVPESSFVPETQINDGKEPLSGTACCGHGADIGEADSMINEFIHSHSLVEAKSFDKSVPGLHENLEIMGIACDINVESAHGEEVGDSQNGHVDAVTRGFQMMDECSRMDFNRRSKCIKNSKPRVATDSVQETWRKLRGCHTDLRQYITAVEKDNSRIVNLAYKMSSLISEADLLLSDCQLLLRDYLDPLMVPLESHALYWYDEQLHMTSAIAQHGFCCFAKNIASSQSSLDTDHRVDLVGEMLASTSNTTALGKLVNQTTRTSSVSYAENSFDEGQPASGISLKCEIGPRLQNIVQSMLPSKSHFTLKGDAVHEYVSSLCQISRAEASRLSESINKKKLRRPRVARHYLSDGIMMLSPEDILLLGQHSYSAKNSPQP
ncbi:uncharacterized protein LOC131162458 isoform X2 [Malania oleifera]|uniref:uncharacterized protein LOC131162458 isoform X2 n=1 Tax=Malania oleifera TaxID=397392 RepID=UPI0025AEAC86|nr:uncharacterized protein LOC131162458 isoform X2 [Malania oleifera]